MYDVICKHLFKLLKYYTRKTFLLLYKQLTYSRKHMRLPASLCDCTKTQSNAKHMSYIYLTLSSPHFYKEPFYMSVLAESGVEYKKRTRKSVDSDKLSHLETTLFAKIYVFVCRVKRLSWSHQTLQVNGGKGSTERVFAVIRFTSILIYIPYAHSRGLGSHRIFSV